MIEFAITLEEYLGLKLNNTIFDNDWTKVHAFLEMEIAKWALTFNLRQVIAVNIKLVVNDGGMAHRYIIIVYIFP